MTPGQATLKRKLLPKKRPESLGYQTNRGLLGSVRPHPSLNAKMQ